jgi:hypothetical protein
MLGCFLCFGKPKIVRRTYSGTLTITPISECCEVCFSPVPDASRLLIENPRGAAAALQTLYVRLACLHHSLQDSLTMNRLPL